MKEVRYVDEQAIASDSNKGLQKIVNNLDMTAEEYDMKLKIKKTEVMRISRHDGKEVKVEIDGEQLE